MANLVDWMAFQKEPYLQIINKPYMRAILNAVIFFLIIRETKKQEYMWV
jgi:hypothetical protein